MEVLLIHSDLRDRVLTRLEAETTDPLWQAAATAALNEGQRLFSLLSLCLENTREFVLTPGVNIYRLFSEGWSDWLVPLRVRLSSDTASGNTAEFDTQKQDVSMFGEQSYTGLTASTSPKLRPATITQLTANDASWFNATGTPTRYGCLGWDLLFLDKKPTQEGLKLLITYARSPVPMVNDSDTPELREADHEALAAYAEARLRANEGGQEMAAATVLMGQFIAAAKERAAQVRARAMAERLDRQPFELEKIDYSKLLAARKDLAPWRRENRLT